MQDKKYMADFEILDGVLIAYHGSAFSIVIPDEVREIRCCFHEASEVYINMGCKIIHDGVFSWDLTEI